MTSHLNPSPDTAPHAEHDRQRSSRPPTSRELRAISNAKSMYAFADSFLERAPLVSPGDFVWFTLGEYCYHGIVDGPEDAADSGPVRILYVPRGEIDRAYAEVGFLGPPSLPALARAAREGRVRVTVCAADVERDQVLKHPSAAAADRDHLKEQRRAQQREKRLQKAADGSLTIGRTFDDGEIAGRAIARYLGLERGLAGWLWRDQTPVSPGYPELAARLLVAHGVFDHPGPADYRYRLTHLLTPDELANALSSDSSWQRDTRHVRKLAECGTPGTELLIDYGRGATEIVTSEGVCVNGLELLASVPGNSMLYGLRVRYANGYTKVINPSLFFAVILPLETARRRWWAVDADAVAIAGPFDTEHEAHAAVDLRETAVASRLGHPAAAAGALQPRLYEVTLHLQGLVLGNVLEAPETDA